MTTFLQIFERGGRMVSNLQFIIFHEHQHRGIVSQEQDGSWTATTHVEKRGGMV